MRRNVPDELRRVHRSPNLAVRLGGDYFSGLSAEIHQSATSSPAELNERARALFTPSFSPWAIRFRK